MRRFFTITLILVIALGGMFMAMKKHAPKPPAPTTKEIWESEGIPAQTAQVVRGDIDQVVEVTGNIEALKKSTLSAKIPGRVEAVYVREGDSVSPGMTIAVLDREDAMSNLRTAQAGLQSAIARLQQAKTQEKVTKIQSDSAIEQAQSALKSAESRLKVVKDPARSQEVLVAQSRVASAKANMDNKEADYKRHEKLLKQGAISESTFDIVKTQFIIAQQDYKSAQEQLSLIKEGGRGEDIDAAQAQVEVAREQLRTAKANASQNLLRREDVRLAEASVDQAKAAVAIARQQVSNTYIKSPISGVVATRRADPGIVLGAGQAVAEVVNLGSLFFEGSLSEKEFANVRSGQPVGVRIDALPEANIRGVVEKVYPTESMSSRNFPVRIRITDSGSMARPGMFVRGEIITGESNMALLVPKDAIEERRGAKMVFVLGNDNKVRRQNIIVVRENKHFAEVKTPVDLNEGDIVITQGRQNLQDKSLVKVAK